MVSLLEVGGKMREIDYGKIVYLYEKDYDPINYRMSSGEKNFSTWKMIKNVLLILWGLLFAFLLILNSYIIMSLVNLVAILLAPICLLLIYVYVISRKFVAISASKPGRSINGINIFIGLYTLGLLLWNAIFGNMPNVAVVIYLLIIVVFLGITRFLILLFLAQRIDSNSIFPTKKGLLIKSIEQRKLNIQSIRDSDFPNAELRSCFVKISGGDGTLYVYHFDNHEIKVVRNTKIVFESFVDNIEFLRKDSEKEHIIIYLLENRVIFEIDVNKFEYSRLKFYIEEGEYF